MTATTDTAIVIRRANEDDALALSRLAQLDAARLPEGELLVAEAGGEIRAALRIEDSAYVADPFFPSRALSMSSVLAGPRASALAARSW